jgi:NAD+--dinitrogen-reductase ADP-D-ribosyltransferase
VAVDVDEGEDDPRRWYSTNLVGVSAVDLASTAFNERPAPLRIAATRETHRGLFTLLDQSSTLEEAAEVFGYYMRVAFALDTSSGDMRGARPRGHRASYVKLLQGWGFDSNSPQGAVLKGWVESRFGIVPTFHTAPLDHFPSAAWVTYLEEKLSTHFHNNCIHLQLDVLYEYCQWTLERFAPLGPSPVRLFRGSHASEAPFTRGSHRARRGVVRLNNIVSFSRARERAEEFGDWVLEVAVPTVKLLFYPGLLHNRVLNGEGEVLAIGGDFEVRLAQG